MAFNILKSGYSVHTNALPEALGSSLWAQSHGVGQSDLKPAGIGRNAGSHTDQSIRSDKILWIDETSPAGADWIKWAAELQTSLNAKLFMGLFSFESHYALYNPGCFYKPHFDSFQGEKNRLLSIIVYLNHRWQESDAGELVLFTEGDTSTPIVVKPEHGTIVTFLSEEIRHEVLATSRDRYSIAGWFCANRGNPLSQ